MARGNYCIIRTFEGDDTRLEFYVEPDGPYTAKWSENEDDRKRIGTYSKAHRLSGYLREDEGYVAHIFIPEGEMTAAEFLKVEFGHGDIKHKIGGVNIEEEDWETECEARDDGMHCSCWYDMGKCCSCGSPGQDDVIKSEVCDCEPSAGGG